jgi:ligand-binding sensor domain-containing protein
MNRRLLAAALFAALLSGGRVSADLADLRFEQIGQGTALADAEVTCILQDRRGFLWFGTYESGLFRYDGYDLKRYAHDPSDGASLGSNRIWTLAEDRDGFLWVGTWGAGLDRFDPVHARFERFRHRADDPASLAHDNVSALLLDSAGALWVGTFGGGLSRVSRTKGTIRFDRFAHDAKDPESLGADEVWGLVETDGVLCVALRYAGLDSTSLASARAGRPRFAHTRAAPGGLPSDNIWSIGKSRDGALWVGTLGAGLARLDAKSGRITSYRERKGAPPADAVRSVFEDSRGTVWLGARLEGLDRLDPAARTVVRYAHRENDGTSISTNQVVSIFEDAEGLLWFGTWGGGVDKLDPRTALFGLHRHRDDDPRSLSASHVTTVLEDSGGALWVGTDKGLNRRVSGPGEPAAFVTQPEGLREATISTLFEDGDGTIFVATSYDGLWWLPPNERSSPSPRFVRGRNVPSHPLNEIADRVLSILRDRAGVLWLGTINRGLFRWDGAKLTRFVHADEDASSIGAGRVYALHEDSTGTLWAGTWEGGLCRLDPAPGAFSCFRHDPSDAGSLSANAAVSIAETSRGELYVGTFGGGLNRLDRASSRFTHVREKDGLSSDFVTRVLVDRRDRLWLGTNRGLDVLDPATRRIARYDAKDGLQSDSFAGADGATSRTKDGRLYFGGMHGFNVFDPDALEASRRIPPVVLTDFLLFNKSVRPGASAQISKEIGFVDAIGLAHADSLFAFQFAALSFRQPAKNRYAYRMEGLDDHWIETDAGDRKAVYTRLPSGRYTFRVRASNDQGRWNEAGAAIAVRILPPWWRTWWARTGSVLLLCAGLFAWHTARTRRLRATALELERQVTERTAQLVEAQEKLARILDSGPEALGDAAAWARSIAADVERAVGSGEILVFTLEGGRLEAMTPTRTAPPPLGLLEDAARRAPLEPVEESGRSIVPVKGPSGQLYGALVVVAPPIWEETERRLVTGFAQQLGGTLEMRRLRSEITAAAARREAALKELHDRGIATLQICPLCGRCADHETPACPEDGTPLESPRPLPYRLLDRYRFERLLGEGGMGLVLAARDERLERDVAIKLIRSEHFGDPEVRFRFEQEARIVAGIAHPGVVALFDSGELADGTAYLVMERLEGRELQALLDAYGRGTPRQVAELVRQGTVALAAAHRAGVIHRDLKPANVFLVDDPRGLKLKLLDFGVAKSLRFDSGATVTGTVVGTPSYMSPEQVQGEPLDARSDVYSFATVVYEALTGWKLVPEEEAGAAMVRVVLAVPEPASRLVPGLPRDVDEALERALEKKREQRPPDIEAWGAALARTLDGVSSDVAGWPRK